MRPEDPGVGDARFWQETVGVGQVIRVLHVEWNESWAHRNGPFGYTAVRIEVAEEDLAKMLPVVRAPVPELSRAGRWSWAPGIDRALASLDDSEKAKDVSLETITKKVNDFLRDDIKLLGRKGPGKAAVAYRLGRWKPRNP